MIRPSFRWNQVRPPSPIVVWVVLLAAPAQAAAASIASYAPSNAAERFIVEELKEGRLPDLAERFADPNQRVISAGFLLRLLTEDSPARSLGRYVYGLTGAVVREPVVGRGIRIVGDVMLEACVFKDYVDFTGAQFGGDLSLSQSEFHAIARFERAVVNGKLSLMLSSFKSGGLFNRIRVEGDLVLDFPVFTSIAQFSFSEIGGNLIGYGVRFDGEYLDFSEAVVKVDADFVRTESTGIVSFSGIKVGRNFGFGSGLGGILPVGMLRRLSTASERTDKVSRLNLSSARVEGWLRISGITLENLDLRSSAVEGELVLDSVRSTSTFLSDVTVRNLIVPDPSDLGLLSLDGARFECLSTVPCGRRMPREEFEQLLSVLRRQPSPLQLYTQFEQYLTNSAQPRYADLAYVAMMRRERSDRIGDFTSLSSLLSRDGLMVVPAFWIDQFKDSVLGYGRRIEPALLWSLLLLAIGALVFRPQDMVPRPGVTYHAPFDRLWYSIDLFIPILQLGYDNSWMVAERYPKKRAYARVHYVAGRVLVAAVISSIWGVFR